MKPCFIAHRGYSGKYLQNTEEAFIKAVEHGSGGIETDVRITKDGVLVVNHNETAVFIDGTELSRLMNDKKIPGVYFREVAFCPTFSKYQGERCEGVQIHVTDREIFEPFYTGLILWDTIRKNYPEFKVKDNAKCLFGSDEIFAPDFDADKFYEKHKIKIAEFTEKTKKYWLYQ